MAEAFFSTLLPFDGEYRHVSFMMRMTTILERLSRGVIERNEREERYNADRDKSSAGEGEVDQRNNNAISENRVPLISSYDVATAPDERSDIHQEGTINYTGHNIIPNDSFHSAGEGMSVDQQAMHDIPVSASSTINNVAQSFSNNNIPLNGFHGHAGMADYSNNNHDNNNLAALNVTDPYFVPEFWQIPLTADWELGFADSSLGPSYAYDYGPGSGTDDYYSTASQQDSPTFLSGNRPMDIVPGSYS